jgi:hypothetical protein
MAKDYAAKLMAEANARYNSVTIETSHKIAPPKRNQTKTAPAENLISEKPQETLAFSIAKKFKNYDYFRGLSPWLRSVYM